MSTPEEITGTVFRVIMYIIFLPVAIVMWVLGYLCGLIVDTFTKGWTIKIAKWLMAIQLLGISE